MGFDRDDTVIRRRLRQKLEFMAEDAIDAAPATEAELQGLARRAPWHVQDGAADCVPPGVSESGPPRGRHRRGRPDASGTALCCRAIGRDRPGRRRTDAARRGEQFVAHRCRAAVRRRVRGRDSEGRARSLDRSAPIGLWPAPRLRARTQGRAPARACRGAPDRRARVSQRSPEAPAERHVRADADTLQGDRRTARQLPRRLRSLPRARHRGARSDPPPARAARRVGCHRRDW